MSDTPQITTYGMPGPSGGRRRSFALDGIQVTIADHEDDERGRRLAEFLAGASSQVERLASENRELRASAPPASAARLLGPGIVRFRDRELWLLNTAEKGWSSFGFRCDGWDDLFRRYDVRVTKAGRDETGDFWVVENNHATQVSGSTQEKKP